MSKLKKILVLSSVFLMLSGMNNNLFAARNTGHSSPINGKYATYELNYLYKDHHKNGGQHRISLSMYDFKNFRLPSLLFTEAISYIHIDQKYTKSIYEQAFCHFGVNSRL